MALDNAEFIAELSISDPPGTDPLNQGDDHIRTIKKAVQQSFPNVDAAVPQTAAQMAQMAIKNEANTFTAVNTFQQTPVFESAITVQGNIFFDAVTDVIKSFNYRVGGSNAWQLQMLAASNNQDFRIRRSDPVGTVADDPFRIGRLTGIAAFTQRMTVSGTEVALLSTNTFTGFQTFSASGVRFFNFANFIRKTGTTGIAGITYEDAAGVGRWLTGQSTAANGERYTWQRRNAAGTVQDSPLEILNTDGHVRILNLDMIRGVDTQNAVIAAMTAGTIIRHTLNFEATGGFNPQSWTFSTFNSSGAFIGNLLRFGPNGELFMENLPTTNPGGTNRLWKSSGFVAIT